MTKKERSKQRVKRLLAKVDRDALKHYQAATPSQRRAIAKHVAKLGVEMMADANGISLTDRMGSVFVDRDTGEAAAFLEHRGKPPIEGPDDESPECNDPHCNECFPSNHLDVAALLGEIAKAAMDANMPLSAVVENVIANLHAWRNPPPEAYN